MAGTKRRSTLRATPIADYNDEKYIDADTAAALTKYNRAHFRQTIAPHLKLERFRHGGKIYYLRDAFNAAKSAIRHARGTTGEGRLTAKKRRAAKRSIKRGLNGNQRGSVLDKIPRVSRLTNPDTSRQLEVIVTPEVLMDMISRGMKMTFKVES
jgi:hypothetical protein